MSEKTNSFSTELEFLAKDLSSTIDEFSKIKADLLKIDAAARTLHESFSGSWVGYHSRIYYKDFAKTPNGARFNPEWGLMLGNELARATGGLSGSYGDWREYHEKEVSQKLTELAAITNPGADAGANALNKFQKAKSEVNSILAVQKKIQWDDNLDKLENQVNGLKVESVRAIGTRKQPSSQFICRDTRAVAEGIIIPAHIELLARSERVTSCFQRCQDLANLAREISKHLTRMDSIKTMQKSEPSVFIGHGRSPVWKDLAEFLEKRLRLKVVEFNSSPTAGLSTVERLEDMLSSSNFAFLIMTGEDTADGEARARLNVVHEIGLFQGRLGFKKAIILLEHDCAEFSNIVGLTQIRFDKGKIKSVFEDIRAVLEREKIIPS